MQYYLLLTEVVVCVVGFAVVYYLLATHDDSHFRNNTHTIHPNPPIGVVDAIYFSLVTQSTVGYGSIVPSSTLAKTIVSLQVFSTIAFVLRWSTVSL